MKWSSYFSISGKYINLNMPRKHKRFLGSRKYHDFTKQTVEKAVTDIQGGMSLNDASEKRGILKSTLHWKIHNQLAGPVGHPKIFPPQLEKVVVNHLIKVSEWGFPFNTLDLTMIGKNIIEQKGMVIPSFKNNVPGKEWANLFQKRYQHVLTQRLCRNMKSVWANLSHK